MEKLTKYKALIAELEPYTPSPLTILKALQDVDMMDWDAEYDSQKDKKSIAVAAIQVLKKLIVLTSDSLGKSSQGYSTEGLQKRIKALCAENGLDATDFVDDLSSVTDGSMYW